MIGRRRSNHEDARLVCDAMSRQVVTIDSDEPVSRAAERLAEQDVGVLAVCGADNQLEGVITDRDIVVRTVAQGFDPETLTTGECATKGPSTVAPGETLEQAALRMDKEQVRRLPVTDGGRLVGIVSQSDLAANGANQRAGRLLARMARKGGDRRSAGWVLRRSYSEGEPTGAPQPAVGALGPLIDAGPSVYLVGYAIGIVIAALALLQLGLHL